MQNLINVHFKSTELSKLLFKYNSLAMLYFIFNKDLVMVLVAHDLREGDFIAQIPYFPPLQSIQDFTPEICKKLIEKSIIEKININVKLFY